MADDFGSLATLDGSPPDPGYSLQPVSNDPFAAAKSYATSLPPTQDEQFDNFLQARSAGPAAIAASTAPAALGTGALVAANNGLESLKGMMVDPLDPEQRQNTVDLAGNLVLGGMGGAEQGAAGAFGGKLAQTAPVDDAGNVITAYHGSPHSFDKFSLHKIGTGEGAQAYGHGLYFAENEGVAKSYKAAGPAADAQYSEINSRLSQLAKDMSANSNGYRNFRDQTLGDQQAAEYDALMAKKRNLGNMYQVGINANPDHFLDWDAPLSEQHPVVQQALSGSSIAPKIQEHQDMLAASGRPYTGANTYAGLAERNPNPATRADTWDTAIAAQRLKDAGIPGIKYYDGGSRGAGTGSRNYVVFDDKTIDILKKYGLAGLGVAGVGAGVLGNPQDAQAHPTSFALQPVSHDPFEARP